MNIALWIVAGVLAAAFVAAGAMKALTPREKLLEKMEWVTQFSDAQVKGIGGLELLGGLGLVLPTIGNIAPVLVPLAATGLALIMAGAFIFHLRQKHPIAEAIPSLVLGLLSVFVAWGRFGPNAF